jgi:hypothetical protein
MAMLQIGNDLIAELSGLRGGARLRSSDTESSASLR